MAEKEKKFGDFYIIVLGAAVAFLLVSLALDVNHEHHHDHGVEWPALRQLDMQVESAALLAEMKDFEELKSEFAKMVTSAGQFATSKVPEDATNPKEVEQYLADLKSLVGFYQANPKADVAQMKEIVNSTHALVVKIMAAAGVPHVHDDHHHDHGDGHGHDGDHGHGDGHDGKHGHDNDKPKYF